MPQIIPLRSSHIATVAYEPTTATLTVHFKKGGSYNYLSVPPSTFNLLIKSRSPGSTLNTLVKPFHKFVKLAKT